MSTESTLLVGVVMCGLALFVFGVVVMGASTDDRPAPLEQLRWAWRRRGSSGKPLQGLAAQASGIAERSLDRSGRRSVVETTLERAGVNMRPGEFLVLVASAAFGGLVLGGLFGGPVIGIVLAGAVVAAAPVILNTRVGRRRNKFEAQLVQTLPLMAGSLRAGFGIMQSLDAVARESESPTAEEFSRIVMESRLGRDLGDSMRALADRVGSDDFEFVVEAIDIQREVGGDLAEVLDNVAGTIRDRGQIRRQIQTLTAEGRFSAVILLALPIIMFLGLRALNPGYLDELTNSTIGKVMLGAAIALMTVGAIWIRRVVRLVF
jgi:tight adherence protein B